MRSSLVGVAVLAPSLAMGCTSRGYAPLNDPHALVATDGIILLDDENGETLPITPDSVVTFETDQGWTEPVVAGRLCRTAVDFTVRMGNTCDGSFRLAPYASIRGVHVETADRAATVGVVTAVSAAAVGILVVLGVISPFRKAGKSSSGSAASSSVTPAAGPTLKYPPRTHVATRALANIALNTVAANAFPSSPSGELPEDAPPVPVEGPSFTPREVRRASVSVLASVDGRASLFSRDGLSTGAHVGLRVDDFIDIGVGGRWLDGGSMLQGNRVVPTAQIGLHGELPRARWFALGLSVEGGRGNDVDVFLDARFGARLEPVRGLWLGLYPLHPSYIAWSNGGAQWIPQSSADLSFGF